MKIIKILSLSLRDKSYAIEHENFRGFFVIYNS